MVRFATFSCVPRPRQRDIAAAHDRDDNSWQASAFGVESVPHAPTTAAFLANRLDLDKPSRKF
jgi:hypothetical protein